MSAPTIAANAPAPPDVSGPVLAPAVPTPTDSARRWLMTALALTLAFVVVGSFAYSIYSSANVMTWLQAVLPVVSGLVGAAGGFYFGQQSAQ
jgi:hypothetical protein